MKQTNPAAIEKAAKEVESCGQIVDYVQHFLGLTTVLHP
jgi:hypothetical protein